MQSSQGKVHKPTTTASSGTITVPLRDIAQLLDPDPPPFREGVVTPQAEDYILKAAKKLPGHELLRIVVDLPGSTKPHEPADIADKITGHFRSAAEEETREVRELFRYGRKALLIGVLTLSACLFLAWLCYEKLPQRPITRLMQESFVILGWVSMWRPIEIFLYDWLPHLRRLKLFDRLSDAAVVVTTRPTGNR
jgi:hypothetical protein